MEKEEKIQKRRARRLYRRILIWSVGVLVLVGAVWGIVKLSASVQLPGEGSLALPVNESDNVLGPDDAPITVVEYSDFQCPACAAFHDVLKQALSEPDAANRVKLIYRHFPLQYHANAQIAAQASQAAALQGKFWEMHDKMFSGQSVWSVQSNSTARQTFIGYARELGLDIESFTEDMDSESIKDKVSDDRQSGLDSGVNATPTFFINGVKMPQPESYEQFKNFILNGIMPSTQ